MERVAHIGTTLRLPLNKETVAMDRYVALGVVTSVEARPVSEIDELFSKLNKLFENTDSTKADIVRVMKDFLPFFDHIEKGKKP